ncbi:MAG: prepilin-type N-terminal cleavage/methylation domain-containing protein [Mariprofundaceae bacterium]|nr:prepilin-type N-terminal cleavage/methylation domain-containing protein [Mariprofundaceae bacterium]
MPTSATGSSLTASTAYRNAAQPRLRGFTLLEIMLVIAVMAIVAGFVIPNLFRPATATLDDAARQLVRLLHVASEEAQLRSAPLRWNAYSDHYEFQVADSKGEWHMLSAPPFRAQALPHGVKISDIRLADSLMQGFNSDNIEPYSIKEKTNDASDKNKKPPLASLMFMSDGMLSVADVFLQSPSGDLVLELRPGPAGIRVRKDVP